MRRAMAHSALTFASVLMIAALAGCGGGGKTAVPLPMPVTAPEDSPLTPGATSIPAGESRTVGDADGVRTVATCPADGETCVFTVAQDGSATFTGGEPTVTTISYTTLTGLPEGHTLTSGTIPAGESRTVRDADGRRTVVTCPAGGEACMVTVGDDGGAEATGGAPTVTTISYTPITGLPAGHRLATGTLSPGESRTVRDADGMRTVVTCPAGGAACMVTVGDDGGAEATGGVPTVATISYTTLTGLPEGHSLASGTIPAGESRTVRDADGMRTVVTCPAGGAACMVSVGDDGRAEATGGSPTVATISYTTITLPEGHSLATGTIPAGESRTVRDADGRRTVVTCPAGGEACMVTVGDDGGAEATGGAPTVTTISYTPITGLPAGHRLATGTLSPGESRTVRDADGMRTVVTCPAGGAACMVTVGDDGGAEATGGVPTVATISYTTLTGLPEGHSLASGTIPAGESRTVRDADGMRTVVTCPAGGAACMVSVGDDGRAEATGGSPTVATISYTTITLPEGHSLATGTIPAGESRTVRDADGMRTVVTCPAGGAACMVSVGEDGRAEATGGVPTVVTISYTTITGLPEGALEPGTFSLSPGESRVLQETAGMRTLLTCPAGGEACVVSVGDDGAATSTGGAPTVATYTPIDLPGGHTLETGTLPPGETRTVWSDGNVGTLVTCPADGEACVFRVEDGAAEYTGGTPAVTTEITGLSGHTLTVGTTIPAGGSRSAVYSRGRGSNVVCPAGGEDCFVAWVSDSVAEFTGGAPTLAAVSNEMVWQANNGPEGTSDGAHARGLEGALLSGSSLDSMFRNVIGGWTGRAGGSIVQSSAHPEPAVTATASWASGTAPTLGLTLGALSFSLDGDSSVPSLGEGWNGVALENDLATFRQAVLYSNIERPSGGTPDGYYLTLGAWVIFPDDPAAGSASYDMGAFANGHSATALNRNAVLGLTGTATYQGPATGLYTAATYTGSGGTRALQSATVGSFTATATINADFGAGTTAVNGMGGSITDFEENGQSLGNWTVSLPTTAQVQSGALEIFFGRTGGSADGRGLSGNWGVQFYRDGTSGHPHSAVGVFTSSTSAANNDALHMVGAYGAERN